ncbi:MAG: N-acetylmuramic acid 6-phosphate etherase [Myxococcales bacterium]|nr:N-acetylmuramic acid 6-phosphate etherase [Myxococcales bacterium]MCZ6714767.1 N-acetylmuramic acid 6-phosphate etherase [Deltaproteobacteria bacterium]TDJ01837.1 MAG: N-acetylmuramic acid 6-phosphate etherase [Deltaproteobacteria bacterium]
MSERDRFEKQAGSVVTEQINPRTRDIDQLPLRAILERILDEDAGVPEAVRRALPALERAGELLLTALRADGRWFNLGAGTSGRIGLLDAAEIPPTYGLAPERMQAVLAGGDQALTRAIEGAEDDRASASRELDARGLCERDVLLALSASGETPFVLGGVEHARRIGARTIGLTCTPDSSLVRAVDCPVVIVVGPEAIAGSTRMKGGLAQKMALHMLSTSVMVQLGRVRSNLMVEIGTRTAKLRKRALGIVMQLSGQDRTRAERALEQSGGSVAKALELLEKY